MGNGKPRSKVVSHEDVSKPHQKAAQLPSLLGSLHSRIHCYSCQFWCCDFCTNGVSHVLWGLVILMKRLKPMMSTLPFVEPVVTLLLLILNQERSSSLTVFFLFYMYKTTFISTCSLKSFFPLFWPGFKQCCYKYLQHFLLVDEYSYKLKKGIL